MTRNSFRIKPLVEELKTYLVKYKGRNLLPSIDEILDRLNENPRKCTRRERSTAGSNNPKPSLRISK